MFYIKKITLILFIVCSFTCIAQPPKGLHWSEDGNGYYKMENGGITYNTLPDFSKEMIVTKNDLTPKGASNALKIRNFFFSPDHKKVLIYTNSKKVWRYDTKGDYWVLDLSSHTLKQLGKGLPESSMMFAKFSPDNTKVAYVSNQNIYVEDLVSGKINQETKDGTDHLINGTFDWAYEEEFGCRDGFRWSPDSKSIAYWQIDASKIRNFLLIDNTDSIYSFTKPVEYPKTGQDPSSCKIGVVNIATGKTKWMEIPGDPIQHYIPRMEWTVDPGSLIVQQLNRKQNESNILVCDALTGKTNTIYTESDKAWIDIKSRWNDDDPSGWDWINNGKAFIWVSEKDGWRHIYTIGRHGKNETLITKGNYDIISITAINDKEGYIYFMASPDHATQQYLFRTKLDGSGIAEKLSPQDETGTHNYEVSPNGKFANHNFSNLNTPPLNDWVDLSTGKTIKTISNGDTRDFGELPKAELFTLTTADGISMDGWIIKPANFDSTKKYPVVFYVYTEPAAQTVTDSYGSAGTFLYAGDMAGDGYIQISLDGRGTPAPKGAEWRKSIYKKVGIINIHDQAMATKKIMEWPFVDTSRIAVWGWSGGGSTTLNLLFQYPDIYKTGIAIAPVANQLTYDNIYEERYMGLPQEDMAPYTNGSPITYAKNLKGHLLIIHGTGDDNVHYQNTEMLVNELVKYNKQFQMMSYPNRTHSLAEGQGTDLHLVTLFTNFLHEYCPGGGR
ncbi:MAG: S9 family peptidase [Bacteroidetes bacterium]|nr:S9 family peptidase [Bacteroidota bacterium]